MKRNTDHVESQSTEQTGHTPGPWNFDDSHGYGCIHVAEPADQNEPVICEMFCSDFIDSTTIRANARLIAAAPELLETCKFLFGEIESGNLVRDITKDSQSDWSMRMMTFTMNLGKAQAAIAKAEGK